MLVKKKGKLKTKNNLVIKKKKKRKGETCVDERNFHPLSKSNFTTTNYDSCYSQKKKKKR